MDCGVGHHIKRATDLKDGLMFCNSFILLIINNFKKIKILSLSAMGNHWVNGLIIVYKNYDSECELSVSNR